MYRVAFREIHDAGVRRPNGMHHCIAVVPECADVGLGAVFAAPNRVAPERARMARYATTTLAAPLAIADAACRRTPMDPPPPYGTRLDQAISEKPVERTSSVSSTGSTV
jgi:hypothetical protein